MAESPGRLPFKEAIKFFRDKIKLPTAGWTDIWQEHHSHAFVVAGATEDALLSDLYNAILKARHEGMGYADFREAFPEIAKKYGWAYNGSPGWRSRIIYDTNITQATNAGRYKQMMGVRHLRPFWRYRHTSIEHPRLAHKSWDGLILPADDPWWDTHYPQNGWGCKCRVESLSRWEAEEEWKKTGKTGPDAAPPIEWEEKIVGKNSANPRVVKVPKGIDPGFAYNPGKAWLEPHTVPPLPEGLARLVPDTWPWPEGYKLPVVPDFHPVGADRLLDASLSNTVAVENALAQMGATLTAPAVHISQAGYALVVGAGMFIPYGAAYNAELGDEQFKMALEGKSGRKKYMNLLVDAILDPDEIWVSWETVRANPKFEGEKFKVMHHLKAFVITDADGKKRFMVAVFRKSRYGWDGITTFTSSGSQYFEKMRRGWLAYKK